MSAFILQNRLAVTPPVVPFVPRGREPFAVILWQTREPEEKERPFVPFVPYTGEPREPSAVIRSRPAVQFFRAPTEPRKPTYCEVHGSHHREPSAGTEEMVSQARKLASRQCRVFGIPRADRADVLQDAALNAADGKAPVVAARLAVNRHLQKDIARAGKARKPERRLAIGLRVERIAARAATDERLVRLAEERWNAMQAALTAIHPALADFAREVLRDGTHLAGKTGREFARKMNWLRRELAAMPEYADLA